MANWMLRRAVAGDADALAACFAAAYADAAARIADLPDVAADCAGEIARHQVWVALVGGAVAGGLVLAPHDGFMLLANVAVDPTHRGVGLGRALIAHADAEALRQGHREMRLSTHAAMPENLRLYARLGWRETGRRGNKVTLTKTLSHPAP